MSDVTQVDVAQLESALAAGAHVIDVREADEYAQGHIPGARNVPLSSFTARVSELPTDDVLYIVCAVGGRSQQAAEYLLATGINAVNVSGGTQAWESSGRRLDYPHHP